MKTTACLGFRWSGQRLVGTFDNVTGISIKAIRADALSYFGNTIGANIEGVMETTTSP